jgi:NAD(P)-dependent dehydrogenase (short-subunit alcohol dehydrogenase family)
MSNSSARQVLVTGGTGTVGRALVASFKEAGFSVTFQYHLNDDLAKAIATQFKATPLKLDLESPLDLPATHFDVIVNNAAVNLTSELTLGVTPSQWDYSIAVNLTAPFHIIQRYLPEMISRGWGRIVMINSIYGFMAAAGNLPYTVSKHGLSGLTKTVAKEYAAAGITCNEICPGPIQSDLMERIAERETRGTDSTAEKYLQEVCEEIPAKRMATPQDVASLAVFLSSDAASYINGASVVLDGGLVA